MNKQDLSNNHSHDSTSGEEQKFIQDSERKYPEEAKGVASVNVKNASASGDGALGRSEEDLNNNSSSQNAEID